MVEILIVIGLIAVLAAITLKVADSVSQSQSRSKAAADMANMATALEAFKGMYNDYPRLNAKGGVENCARRLYKCLAGQSYMKLEKGHVTFVDVEKASDYKPFLDISTMTVGDPSDPFAAVTNLDNDRIAFIDPWGNPYMYYYDPSVIVGAFGAWEGTSFFLMSNGSDGEGSEVQSMFSTGIMPSEDDFRSTPKNLDNIVFGWD
ncbi:MAG: hypothetical protein IKO42_05785 [Opitutales bacterium]|nr:hypothetical protein [Opitutales bacterium]